MTPEELQRKLHAIAMKARELLQSGDLEGALKIVRDIQANTTSQIFRFPVGGILIDIGSTAGDETLIKEGVGVCEALLDSLDGEDENRTTLHYNIATGYGELYQLQRMRDPEYGLFNAEAEAQKAKEHYRAALKTPPEDSFTHAQLLVNAGNCFDNLGRGIDALDLYERALSIEPGFGMAMANKGLALDYYSQVTDEHRGTYLHEAYHLISDGLRSGVPPETEPIFRQALGHIREQFEDRSSLEQPAEFPDWDITAESSFEEAYIEFCLEHGLFLNFCTQCRKCEAATGDPVHLQSMVVYQSDLDPADPVGSDPFLRLSSYLNQIKQDFVAARFLLVQSQQLGDRIDFVDRDVLLVDPLDYSEHSIYIELLKNAYKSFFGVLDKIAAFINSYLDLGVKESQTYFSKETLWYDKKTIRPSISSTKNRSLNALFDMFLDVRPGGGCQCLRDTRNALTHRFLNVRLLESSEDTESVTQETLLLRTLELARLVRCAIIYLLCFVQAEEGRKVDSAEGVLVPLEVFPLHRPIDDG